MRATTPEQSAAIPTSRSRTRTEPAGRAHPRRCRTCGVGRTPTRRGEVHDLQVTYDEQGRPYQVFDHSNSVLSLYDWSTGEPILQGEPQALDLGCRNRLELSPVHCWIRRAVAWGPSDQRRNPGRRPDRLEPDNTDPPPGYFTGCSCAECSPSGFIATARHTRHRRHRPTCRA